MSACEMWVTLHLHFYNTYFIHVSYLSEQKGDGSKGKRPAILVAEVGLITFGPVQHFIVNVGDVQHKTNNQRQTCVEAKRDITTY